MNPIAKATEGLLVPNAPPLPDVISATVDAPSLLRSLGFDGDPDLQGRLLGSGAFARAFSTPSGKVLKLTTDSADAEVAELVRRAVHVPGLVRVESVARMPSLIRRKTWQEPTADLYAIVVERVYPLNDMSEGDEAQQLAVAVGALAHEVVAAEAGNRSGNIRAEDAMATADSWGANLLGRRYLRDLVRGWIWMSERGFRMRDLHHGNVGLTEGGAAVILDMGMSGSEMSERPEIELAANPRVDIRRSPMIPNLASDLDATFDEAFDVIEERFPDFGEIEFYEDSKAGADNGAGAERQFAYCQDGKPISIAFAPKAKSLPRSRLVGLMRHEFGHALEYRFGVKELERRLGRRLPGEVERRADAIAESVWEEPIVYDKKFVQCVGVKGTSPRPRHLPDAKETLRPNPGAVSVEEGGVRFVTGEPVTLKVTHKKQKTPYLGSTFGQDVEPAGRYVLHGHHGQAGPATEAGGHRVLIIHDTVRFENPLVLPYDGWKQKLSEQYGGKTGKALSRALVRSGHDGIVTFDRYGTSEIVQLPSGRRGSLRANPAGDTAILPKGSRLFHGSLEPFDSSLRPGGDGVLWFSDSPAIAQLYIPCSGISMFASVSSLSRPADSGHRSTQALQKFIGIDYDYDSMEFDSIGRPRSWSMPAGFARSPTKEEVMEMLRAAGFELKGGTWDPQVEVNMTLSGGEYRVIPPGECREGRLFVARPRRDMRIYVMSRGEGDLTDVQYNEFDFFEELERRGFDGLLIDDFAQSEEWGNFGHLSVGLFASAARDLDVNERPAQYREWERERENSTPEYPERVQPYFQALQGGE